MSEQHDYKNYPELSNTELESLQFDSPHPQITSNFYATVSKVHDGDTVTLNTSFRDFDFPLRFSDIDAPELNAGGDVAKDWLINKIEGKEVEILIDPKNRVEKWGRLLGRVFYLGIEIGQEEMYLGLAKPYGTIKEGEVPNAEKVFSEKQWF